MLRAQRKFIKSPLPVKATLGVHKEQTELKSTQEIEFSQASVAPHFTDGTLIKHLTNKLLTEEIDVSAIPPIRVIYTQRRWFTLDNRRLRAFKDAFVPQIPVIVSDFSDPNIKKEFFEKKTNRSVTEGGIVRASIEKSEEHFDGGVFAFNKRVLSWNIEQLVNPLPSITFYSPLPAKFDWSRGYYSGFLELILEEARASLQAGIEVLEKSKVESLSLSLLKTKQAKKPQNPSTLVFYKQAENLQNKIIVKPSDAYLLTFIGEDVAESIKLLALVNYTPNEDITHVTFKVVLDQRQPLERPEAFTKNAAWRAAPLGTLVTHLRMFDVCTAMPKVSWLNQILMGDLQEQPVTPTNLIPVQYPADLNDSQKAAMQKFLYLKEGIQLVQGPPGTGKTTMVIELLKLLIPQGRILVCAPSNKAIQVLADRFSSKYREVPVILNGVEDKLPKEQDRLQDIFIHTWAQEKLTLLAKLKETLWTLLPKGVFCGAPQLIKLNIKKAAETMVNLEKEFLQLAAKLAKYSLRCLAKEEVEAFRVANKNYRDLITDPSLFTAVSNFIMKEKNLDHESAALLESNLTPLFNNLKKTLNKISESLTKVEYALNTMDVEAELLAHSAIIFSTLSVSGRKNLKELTKIESLVIDEAGQAVEAETLIPFFTQPKKCLLIGDPKQLPATVLSPLATKLKFERSMMSRLIEDNKQIPSMLTTQYRMHPEIRHWPSAQYYEAKLQDGASILQRAALMENAPPFLAPYAFINVPGKETSSGHSFENLKEIHFIVRLIHHLEKTFSVKANQDVGVITFYKGQALRLQESLKQSHPTIKIQTVDSFQGDENKIIIISFVRSNAFGNVGFIKDFRRLNVALTRAMHSLILVGNAETLEQEEQQIAPLIKNAKKRKCFFEQEAVEKSLVAIPQKPAQFSKQNPRKPALCHYYNGKPNSCRKDEKCDFSHENKDEKTIKEVASSLENRFQRLTLQEQTTSAPLSFSAASQNQSKKMPAAFAHFQTKPQAGTTFAARTSTLNRKKQEICHYFNGKPNSCNKGTQCDFLHTRRQSAELDWSVLRKK
jgi:hypothetical protein